MQRSFKIKSQEYTEDGEKKWYIFVIKYGIFKE